MWHRKIKAIKNARSFSVIADGILLFGYTTAKQNDLAIVDKKFLKAKYAGNQKTKSR